MRITFRQETAGKRLEDMFGLFFEDLNHAADGGLYAEMLRNRDFEFSAVDRADYTALTAWATVGNAQVDIRTDAPLFPENPHYALYGEKLGTVCVTLDMEREFRQRQENATAWYCGHALRKVQLCVCGCAMERLHLHYRPSGRAMRRN